MHSAIAGPLIALALIGTLIAFLTLPIALAP